MPPGAKARDQRASAHASRAPRSRRMSFSTPAAVTAGPAPGPVMTSGFAGSASVVNTNWLSVPLSDGERAATRHRPQADLRRRRA